MTICTWKSLRPGFINLLEERGALRGKEEVWYARNGTTGFTLNLSLHPCLRNPIAVMTEVNGERTRREGGGGGGELRKQPR